jgi:glucose-1-phosphate cytidylyltransferase
MKLKAIILCGGKGMRLRPITKNIPKPLVEVNSKPILGYLLEHLDKSPIDEYYIATGYKSEKINDYFIKNKFRKKVTIVNSGNVDIIKRIKDCLKFFKNEDFMIMYGDTLSNININKIIKFHKSNKSSASVALWKYRSNFGIIKLNNENRVTSYHEKPILDDWINIGYFYFSSNLISKIKKYRKYENFLAYLVNSNQLSGYKHNGLHYTVNTEEELNQLTRDINKLKKNK